MDNEAGIETHPFTPFIPQNAKILMLGTFPPKPVRWAMEFYYPNRINDMWRIMGLIFYGDKNTFWNEEKKTFRLDEIKRFLTEKGIAMFDTATRIRRLKDNASDKFLEIVEETDIMKMLAENPTIEAIVTTGEKAASVVAEITSTEIPKVGEFIIFKANNSELRHYRLPSSSRAYPLALEKKAEAYKGMFRELSYAVH
ncbi:MAG: uracil-DNA glycosylase family protein [Muribaculaceae bacterium]|jgi:G:T/U-mismatch repair DNA glycosylase|nr:uracil-DNA glycosylase family protein [Muribaculaceae bacterium]